MSESAVDWLLIHSRHLMSRLIRGNHWSWAQRWFWAMGTGRGIRGRRVLDVGAPDTKRIFCKPGLGSFT